MNRRQFAKSAMLAAAGGSTAALTGCPTASEWFTIAIDDLPTILQIVSSIIAIAEAPSVSAPLEQEIKSLAAQITTDLRLAQVLVQSYANKPEASILSQIDSVLVDAQQNLSALLAAFHVADPTLQVTISAVVGLAITAVTALEAIVPAPQAASVKRLALSQRNGSNAMKQAFNVIVAGHYPVRL